MSIRKLEKCSPENPLILVNFKNFAETTGESCLLVAKEIEKAAKETGLLIGISVQSFFLAEIVRQTELLVFSQHLDSASFGSSTGALIPEALKASGGVGSLLNHSEKRVDLAEVEKTVARMREVGLSSVVCAESVEEGERVAGFAVPADFVAIEPPELIGGDVSVSTARPELISDSVQRIGGKVLVGAGIKNGQDLRVALDRGACGILVASGVCKAESPYEVMMDFARAVKKG